MYPDGNEHEDLFTKCDICVLMKESDLYEYVLAMYALDYAMSEVGRASTFIRKYTLAHGGNYCDCGYKKKIKSFENDGESSSIEKQ